MKTINKFLLRFLTIILIISFGCKEEEPISQESQSIKYLSHKSEGCGASRDISELEKINDDTTINWQYSNNNLKVDLLFTLNCAVTFSDSVSINQKEINIYLRALNEANARCMCRYKESFNFNTPSKKELRIVFRYKSFTDKDYTVLADSIISF